MSKRLTDDGLMGVELELDDPESDPAALADGSIELDDPTAFTFGLNESEMELGLVGGEDNDSELLML